MQTETKGLFLFTQPSLKTSSCKPLLLFEGNLCLIKIDFHVITQEKLWGLNSANNVNTLNRL